MRRTALYALSAMMTTTCVARGEVAEHEGRPALNVTVTNELFLLADDGKEKANGETPLAKLLAAAKSGRKVVIVTVNIR